MPRLGGVADPRDVDGEEDSADTKTDEEYGPGEFFFHVSSVACRWEFVFWDFIAVDLGLLWLSEVKWLIESRYGTLRK